MRKVIFIMITQKEIAEKLGISRTTVARAINGSSLIKEETKNKILELVKEMNYEKNYIGSSLAGKRAKKVYCLVINSKNVFYTQEIIRGLSEAEKEFKALLNRLSRIEGQVRGVRSMLENDAYCIDILTQVSAINAALNSFNKVLIANHIRTCVAEDIRQGKEETIEELVTTLQKLMR